MTAVHLHLIITHFPITGFFFAAVLMAWGLLSPQSGFAKAGLYLVIFCALCAVVAYFSGENAEEIADTFDAGAKFYLEEHEDAAKLSLISGIISGVLAAASLLAMRKYENSRKAILPALVAVMVSLGLFVYTGNLGGKIRHSEVRESGMTVSPKSGKNASEHDDD
jgi:uncharacterized membrane protein